MTGLFGVAGCFKRIVQHKVYSCVDNEGCLSRLESSTRCSTSISRSVSQTLILDLHVLTSSHRGGAHNAGPQMICAATFHASYNK